MRSMDERTDRPETKPTNIVYLIDRFGRGGGTENQLAILINNLDRTKFNPMIANLRPREPEKRTDVNCPIEYFNVRKIASLHFLRSSHKSLFHFL